MGTEFDIQKYHELLCPDAPDFINDYAGSAVLQRLAGIGLLCGTDWTPLFHNHFFYSRLDHSIGVARIVWHFTHSKKQTLAGLFHDVSTPVFSHVIDFMNGDALTQESTERLTSTFINEDMGLSQKLFSDGIYKYEIDDYHKYPVADNAIPGLSADRLEYMYPSGAALDGIWAFDEVKENYAQVRLLKNERGEDELGFASLEAAEQYVEKFTEISLLLQHNEDKVAMQLLADCVRRAMECGYICEDDLYTMSEKEVVLLFDSKLNLDSSCGGDADFSRMFRTYRGMKKIVHSDVALDNAFNVSMDVKKRYVNPLVLSQNGKTLRTCELSANASAVVKDFLSYSDTKFGSVPWL